jgi:hypothetical protein
MSDVRLLMRHLGGGGTSAQLASVLPRQQLGGFAELTATECGSLPVATDNG